MGGFFCHNVTMSLAKIRKNNTREKNNSDTSGNFEGTSHFLLVNQYFGENQDILVQLGFFFACLS